MKKELSDSSESSDCCLELALESTVDPVSEEVGGGVRPASASSDFTFHIPATPEPDFQPRSQVSLPSFPTLPLPQLSDPPISPLPHTLLAPSLITPDKPSLLDMLRSPLEESKGSLALGEFVTDQSMADLDRFIESLIPAQFRTDGRMSEDDGEMTELEGWRRDGFSLESDEETIWGLSEEET